MFHGQRGARGGAPFVEAYGADIPAVSPELTEPLLHWHGVGSTFTRAMRAAVEAWCQPEQEGEGAAA
jgi:hypothetical protein